MFRFKHFSIRQQQSTMKVGTDGVLIGAWAKTPRPKHILDIGCGTGLISLMMAQRYPKAHIIGIDIDKSSVEEARYNAQQSIWSERIKIQHIALQDFRIHHRFDLIVSNPPFFDGSTTSSNIQRNKARFKNSLSLPHLITKSEKLLSKNGRLAMILPLDQAQECQEKANENNLFLEYNCKVKGNLKATPKRIMMQFSKSNKTIKKTSLTIEKDRHKYTPEYIELCRNFYLNF